MVPFMLMRIYSSVTLPAMLPPRKLHLNIKFTTLSLTMIIKQPLNPNAINQMHRNFGLSKKRNSSSLPLTGSH